MAKEDHYKAKYGDWAGNPNGHKPDYSRCCEEVYEQGRGMMTHQCARKAKHGPDGAYCKQHDPAAVKAREDLASAKYAAQRRAERPRWYAKKMLEALKLIADGHNDPRSLAAEIVAEIERD